MQINGVGESFVENIVLEHINPKYANNLMFARLESVGKRDVITNFRLRPIKTKGLSDTLMPGARWNHDRSRRVVSCCWHVYYDVLSELFKFNPAAKVRSAMYSANADTFESQAERCKWHNIGSAFHPCYFIHTCDCE